MNQNLQLNITLNRVEIDSLKQRVLFYVHVNNVGQHARNDRLATSLQNTQDNTTVNGDVAWNLAPGDSADAARAFYMTPQTGIIYHFTANLSYQLYKEEYFTFQQE